MLSKIAKRSKKEKKYIYKSIFHKKYICCTSKKIPKQLFSDDSEKSNSKKL